LKELGYYDSENLVLGPRFADGNRDLLLALALELLNVSASGDGDLRYAGDHGG